MAKAARIDRPSSQPQKASELRPAPGRPKGNVHLLPLPTKKARIIELYRSGERDISRIADRTLSKPSYVAQVLQSEGLIQRYFDLYTHTDQEQNVYSHVFRGALSFRSVEAARQSIQRIDEAYRHFERARDRAGQHQAMVFALTGMNRARWSGKRAEAEVFRAWLEAQLKAVA